MKNRNMKKEEIKKNLKFIGFKNLNKKELKNLINQSIKENDRILRKLGK